MRILHYSLGFPPYRSGGLTKFCMDLMREQTKKGHDVSLLWPGEMKIFQKKNKIRIHDKIDGIGNYEIINPIPIPFDEGVKYFDLFMQFGKSDVYETLLNRINPDVIHIHTLMGLHKSFLEVAKRKGVKLVFTAHDFFPICPKVTMFRHGSICSCVESCEECGVCNNTALNRKKIQILQSPFYRYFKNSMIVRFLRKKHRNVFLCNENENEDISVGNADDFKRLRNYYYSLLNLMDIVHYNSSVTMKVYERFFKLSRTVLISITHSGIEDHRKKRDFAKDCLRIRYMGPEAKGKGFFILKQAVSNLWREGKCLVLDVHFSMDNKPEYIRCHGPFNSLDLSRIFEDTDVLVCPSIWYETFGYTVLEALSYGIPVVLSGTVGAKDIIEDGAGIILHDISSSTLEKTLRNLDNNTLKQMNDVICKKQRIETIDMMENVFEKELYNF